jgi:choline dehydrogenase-like flavoprotein
VAEHHDVIIAGSGAGDGTLAQTLAPSGKRIVLLEHKHADGISPAWPLSCADFEPWYTKAGQHHLGRMS